MNIRLLFLVIAVSSTAVEMWWPTLIWAPTGQMMLVIASYPQQLCYLLFVILKPSSSNHFSTFWLRSSVVSALISLKHSSLTLRMGPFQRVMTIYNEQVRQPLSKVSFWCPDWCGSVDWVPAWGLKGCRFDSWSGHMPGLWARSTVRDMREATISCLSLYLTCATGSLCLSHDI